MLHLIENLWYWVRAHAIEVLSLPTILALWKVLMSLWNWRDHKKLLKCAELLRAKAEWVRYMSSNPAPQFKTKELMGYLAKDATRIDRVLELMEEKGWAKKIPNTVGLWYIN